MLFKAIIITIFCSANYIYRHLVKKTKKQNITAFQFMKTKHTYTCIIQNNLTVTCLYISDRI